MKKITTVLAILFFVLLITSCKRDKDELIKPSINTVEEKTLADFFIKNGMQSQVFIVNTYRDTTLYFNSSYLDIPKNSFVHSNNQPVTGAITIEARALLNKKDMILNGIFPVSNQKPLISGGEFYIKVTQNDVELNLASGTHIAISSPIFGTASNNMQVFYANELNENTDWGSPSVADTIAIALTSFYSYYYFPCSHLHWINCDYFYNNPGIKTTVKVSLNNIAYNFNNTHVFITLDGFNSACMFNSYTNPYFFTGVNYQIPLGQKVTFIAISKINGQYFSAFQSATIVDNHIENLTLNPTTLDDFKLQLESLH